MVPTPVKSGQLGRFGKEPARVMAFLLLSRKKLQAKICMHNLRQEPGVDALNDDGLRSNKKPEKLAQEESRQVASPSALSSFALGDIQALARGCLCLGGLHAVCADQWIAQ